MTLPVQEDEVLQRIRRMLENGIEAFGLRDDAAVLDVPAGGPLVVSVDSVVEGIHVDLSLCSPGDVGWKALMGALSDLAAMGATPLGGPGGALRARRLGRRGADAGGHGGCGRGLAGPAGAPSSAATSRAGTSWWCP